MNRSKLQGADTWAAFYRERRGNTYPDENLIRLIRGSYADIPRSGRMVDVGFGRGANLIFFAESGFECHGFEVSQESLDAAREMAERAGVNLTLGLLTNTTLPYEKDYFDIVLSWSAVYYHGSRSAVREAISEFHRIIRPGGVLLMSVIHPNSFMTRRLSEDLGDGTRRIDREDPHDNRFGLKIFYDATSSGWRNLLTPFNVVEEGYVEMDLFNPARRDAWRLFLARKQD